MKRFACIALMAMVAFATTTYAGEKGSGCCQKAKLTTTTTTTKQDCATKTSCGTATLTAAKQECATKTNTKATCSSATLTAAKQECATKTNTKATCGSATLTAAKQECATKTNTKASCDKAALTTTKQDCSKSSCDKAALTTTKQDCSSKSSCSMPTMTFKVNGKATSCSQEAHKMMATQKDAKMVYCVDGKEYCDKEKAFAHLVNNYEKMAANFCTVQGSGGEQKTCPITGTKYTVKGDKGGVYTVAGRNTSCSDQASKMAMTAKAAMKNVAMTYRVNGKDFCCDKMAGAEAEKTKAELTYVVKKRNDNE